MARGGFDSVDCGALVTVTASAREAMTALAAGFQAHSREPVDLWELCRAVAGLVRRA